MLSLQVGSMQLCTPAQCLHLRDTSLHQELHIILTSNRIPETKKPYPPSSMGDNSGEGQPLWT
uniref:Uncharacterized protein n=1 Tax=Mus musculus TaxID=10090 RepID=Q3USY2_MOUSE|nr:unnamed protein product [Mus musculus]